ncbi:MAG TPA: (d)CMP kinase [Stellaceae bacterium]|nr:(d)CMP kinase [Stellaceae bacterium]
MSAQPFVVAIDGPAASGKGTLARQLAGHFGLAHLDTGKLYRAAALILLEGGGDPKDPTAAAAAARRVDGGRLGDPQLDDERVAAVSSLIAAVPAVRAALLAVQRNFAADPPAPARGAVLDGRDIGSVVCPEAPLKLFVTASLEERARRRVEELRRRGAPAIYEHVLQELNQRDTRDSNRRVAPLTTAPDAVVIDTTGLDPDKVFKRAAGLVAQALKEKEWL